MRKKTVWQLMDDLIRLLSLAGAVVAALALALIAFSVIVEVIARSLLDSPTIWAVEISTYAIIAAGFLGSAFVLRRGRHLEIHLLTSRLSRGTQTVLGIFTDIAAALFCLIVVIYGMRFVELSQIMGAVSVSELRIPLWIPQITIPAGFALLGLEFLARILARLGLVDRVIADNSADAHA